MKPIGEIQMNGTFVTYVFENNEHDLMTRFWNIVYKWIIY